MADVKSYFQGYDLDTGGGSDLVVGVNLRLSASGGAIEAIGQQLSAASLPVVIASDQSAVAVNTELAAAAALSDAFANPTTATAGAMLMGYNGASWDRIYAVADGAAVAAGTKGFVILGTDGSNYQVIKTDSGGAVQVDIESSATITVDTELSAAAASADNFANPTVPGVMAFGMVWDSATWDRLPGNSSDGAFVKVTNTVTVDTELLAAAALADAVANPSPTSLGAYLIGYNGATWDRVRTANTGRLQVDVITGGGTDTPTSPVIAPVTSSALAAAASVALNSPEAVAKKLQKVVVWSSVAFKATLHTVDNGVESGVLSYGGGQPFMPWEFSTPHRDYIALGTTAGADNFRINITNLDDANAADVYCTFYYQS